MSHASPSLTDWRTAWPLWAAVAVLLVGGLDVLDQVRTGCDGGLVYALDDAYIHLAMADNLRGHGVWGVTPYGFTSSSSSPLWTVLLAGLFAVGGPWIGWPLVLNALGAILAFGVTWRIAAGCRLQPWGAALFLGAVLVMTPFWPVAFAGMEHVLHVAAVLWLVERLLAGVDDGRTVRHSVWLGVAALVAAGLRYETLFLAAPAGLMLVVERRWRDAGWLAAGTLLPGVVYALFSLSQGGHWLPDTLLLKGAFPEGEGLVAQMGSLSLRAVRVAFMGPIMYLTFLAGAAAVLWVNLRPVKDAVGVRARRLLLVWLGAFFLHFTLAQGGWFYRYEAYVGAVGVVVVAVALAVGRGRDTVWARRAGPGAWLPAVMLAGCVVVPLLARGVTAVGEIPIAARNIYQQQVQMGRFLEEHAPAGLAVAANDVGAINFLGDIRCLDLVGLATPEILAARRGSRLSQSFVSELAEQRDVRWAVLYADLLGPIIPDRWRPVERWTIPDLLVCASPTVTWYACRPEETEPLQEALRVFRERLPEAVEVEVVR